MEQEYAVGRDPLFFSAVAVFALLTTALPAVFGQATFMLILQAGTLTILLGVALRSGAVKSALWTLIIWVALQSLVMGLLTYFAGNQVESAIRNGFDISRNMLEWLYTEAPLPYSLQTAPIDRLVEVMGVLIGTLLTGGLVGIWLLMGAVNQSAFIAGTILAGLDQGVSGLVAFLPWAILRIAAYISFIALLAEPLWTGNWSITRLWTTRRTLLLTAVALLLLALLAELFLPVAWRRFFT